jgi:hypothetical protein
MRMIFGAIGGIKIGRGNRSTRRKPTPVSLCPPQNPTWQTRSRTPDRSGGKPATNRLSYGAAFFIPISLPPTTCRVTVEVFDPASTRVSFNVTATYSNAFNDSNIDFIFTQSINQSINWCAKFCNLCSDLVSTTWSPSDNTAFHLLDFKYILLSSLVFHCCNFIWCRELKWRVYSLKHIPVSMPLLVESEIVICQLHIL